MRKKIGMMIFFIIISGIFYISIYPFLFHYYDVQKFCHFIYGNFQSLEQVKEQALKENFSFIENNKENHLMIYDKKTMGKTTCFVINKDGKIIANYMGE